MTFTAAIGRSILRTFDYRGQATRAEYWYFALFSFLLSMVLGVVDSLIGKAMDSNFSILELVGAIALLLPQTALTARRFHDAGFSAKWLLAQLLPLVALLFAWPKLSWLLQIEGEPSKAQILEASDEIMPFFLTFLAIGIFFLVVTLLPTRKYAGGNKYAKPNPDDIPLDELKSKGW